ncbi:hypothetical protein AB1207_12440 [Kineococcus endophyticus]|uniref:Uncharacterized protein n=1 Tax=Kineococcus endophyticus TaxID=1181883 RepID=A0ABV3P7G5_9ACTN
MNQAGAAAQPSEWIAAWAEALRTVEGDVLLAEDLLRRLHGDPGFVPEVPVGDSWTSPDVTGPVPEQFAERARRLLARQEEVGAALEEAMHHVRSQTRALAKLDRAESRPVFLDTAV